VKTYAVKEVFYTLQGEGFHAGSPAVFVRFSGCNLWSGRAEDRAAGCSAWCDTDFVGTDGEGGGRHTAVALAALVLRTFCAATAGTWLWRRVVLTGGEPLLQLDAELVGALKAHGFSVHVETNGTRTPPPGIDWLTVSPKDGAPLAVAGGDELKLVFPQGPAMHPSRFVGLEFSHWFLQPRDGPGREAHTRTAVAFCLESPRWRLSLQTHKALGIP
jgi:7-carboxy-7-deazaguanine synthase